MADEWKVRAAALEASIAFWRASPAAVKEVLVTAAEFEAWLCRRNQYDPPARQFSTVATRPGETPPRRGFAD